MSACVTSHYLCLTNFDVVLECRYRKYIDLFYKLKSHDGMFASVIGLARKMLKVPVKYEWESDEE